ncbi:hypothetical protein BHE74_00011295 [Ensete ventricosum]|nr:hypothetical protein BHE74_00011295 [Ensete ventricosum]
MRVGERGGVMINESELFTVFPLRLGRVGEVGAGAQWVQRDAGPSTAPSPLVCASGTAAWRGSGRSYDRPDTGKADTFTCGRIPHRKDDGRGGSGRRQAEFMRSTDLIAWLSLCGVQILSNANDNSNSLHEYSGPEKSRDVHTEALRVYDEEEEPARIVVCRLPETRSFSIRCRRRVFLHPLLLPYPVFFDFMVLAVSDPGCVLLRFHGNKSVRGVICNEIDTALFLANLNKSFRFRTYCMFNSS